MNTIGNPFRYQVVALVAALLLAAMTTCIVLATRLVAKDKKEAS